MLRVEGLTTSYGPVRALDGVSFTAEQGRVTAVLGANGAGKTTLLRTVSGLVRPESGSVHLGDREITRTAAEATARTSGTRVSSPMRPRAMISVSPAGRGGAR